MEQRGLAVADDQSRTSPGHNLRHELRLCVSRSLFTSSSVENSFLLKRRFSLAGRMVTHETERWRAAAPLQSFLLTFMLDYFTLYMAPNTKRRMTLFSVRAICECHYAALYDTLSSYIKMHYNKP